MKYEIGEILNQAIMTGSISLVVEGIDDIKTYESLAIEMGKCVEVFPIGCIEGYSPGCGHIIPAMDAIRELPEGDKEYKKYILGVIDKDVKDFRGEIPINPLILTLKYYSLESHFINQNVIKDAVMVNTKIPESLLGEDFISLIYTELFEDGEHLFLMSLEALRCSLDSQYVSCFKYSYSEGRIFSADDKARVNLKKDELLAFAKSMELTGTIEDFKLITKGKWLIHFVSHNLSSIITKIHERCGVLPQRQCIICTSGDEINSCLYRPKDGATAKSFKNSIFGNLNSPDLHYIKERIGIMA